ncbi:unnamed protein product [Lampetra fluviatilis]
MIVELQAPVDSGGAAWLAEALLQGMKNSPTRVVHCSLVHYMIAKRWSEAVQPRQLAFKPFVVIVATATTTLIAAIAAAAAITAIG